MENKKIGIASDHAGYQLKEFVIGYLSSKGYDANRKRVATIRITPIRLPKRSKRESCLVVSPCAAARTVSP